METVMARTGYARFSFRLRMSKTAERALMAQWDACRWVWNQCVEVSKSAHRAGEECGPARLDKMLTGWRAAHDWLAAGSSVVQQQPIRDFAKSRTKALMDLKNRVPVKRRTGTPRFRKRHVTQPTMNYTLRGFRLERGRLRLAGGIDVSPIWSRALPSVPSSVRIRRDVVGHWYASFVVAAATEPLPEKGRVIGIDWGVKVIATTTSDAHDLPHPEYEKTRAAKLARYQRMMARRKPLKGVAPSNGYRKAKRLAARTRVKVARQRKDMAHKGAKKVVRDHDVIAAEDFQPKFLSQSTMAGKAADAAISVTKTALVNMARKHARVLHLINPMHTTSDCASCGARTTQRLALSQRTYTCSSCGTSSPRDKNSARVMLVRAGFNPAGADRVRPARPQAAPAA